MESFSINLSSCWNINLSSIIKVTFQIKKIIMANTINRNCEKYDYMQVTSKSQETNSSLESQK